MVFVQVLFLFILSFSSGKEPSCISFKEIKGLFSKSEVEEELFFKNHGWTQVAKEKGSFLATYDNKSTWYSPSRNEQYEIEESESKQPVHIYSTNNIACCDELKRQVEQLGFVKDGVVTEPGLIQYEYSNSNYRVNILKEKLGGKVFKSFRIIIWSL